MAIVERISYLCMEIQTIDEDHGVWLTPVTPASATSYLLNETIYYMKRILFAMILCLQAIVGHAEVIDAFKGFYPVTDPAFMKSLNGTWSLKVVKGIGDDKTVPEADGSWGRIPVPGCWEAYGFCEPKYDYPDSLTGYYRTQFEMPTAWKGMRVVLRLDGVLRGYDLWINGQLAGSWESGYNTCLFDITPYLRKNGPQQLAMRVYSRFKGYEFDCFDDWAAMGIFRNVTLFAAPQTHLSDLTVTTKTNGEVTVKTVVANANKNTTIRYEIFDAQGRRVSTGEPIANPQLWTAETPYLYTLKVYVQQKGQTLQTITQKIGIKELTIDRRSASPLDTVRNVLKLNGQPIKLRGVNAHATDPKTVKVISDELTLKDMKMMKEASVNFLRLSHYPREPRFYELADSLGFYLVDEVPFGYGTQHLSDRSFQDILKTRALATVQRDKNHPSVLVWSVGNENPLPQTCVEVGDYVGQLDSSRPYCFPQVGSFFRRFWEKKTDDGTHPFPSQAPVYAPHYPSTGQLGSFYQHMDRPVIFTEYCHTLGIALEDHDRQWEIIERTPGIAGGGVWEWADQGMPFGKKERTTTFAPDRLYGYEEKVYTTDKGGFEMFGNKGTDGLVYADRTPLPNYYELQRNYARAFVDSCYAKDGRGVGLRIVNRYDFLDLKDHVSFSWALTNNRDTIRRGSFSPACAPHSRCDYELGLPETTGLAILHFDISDDEGHTFLHQSFVLNKPQVEWGGAGDPMQLVQRGPLVRAGRKPTLAESLTQKKRLPEKYLLSLDNKQVQAGVTAQPTGSGINVDYTLEPDSADVFRAELGVAYLLDKSIDRVQWIGQGPFASYPGRQRANRYGFWALHQDDLYFEGNRMGVDACLLSDAAGNGVLIAGEGLNLNFELTDRGIVVTVNAAVSGQGPKSSRTAFPIRLKKGEKLQGTFTLSRVIAGQMGEPLRQLFAPAGSIAPFRPFVTQYDTYLMRFSDIAE